MQPPPTPSPELKSRIKHIVAVGSGKGGVGKSTIAWHLANFLSHTGLKIGLLDADVYGPSLPRFFGEHTHPEVVESKLIPLSHDSLLCMSMGFLIPANEAAVWRGPMLMTAVKQMLKDVKWDVNGPIDCLIVDLPPGTGDVPLTLTQQAHIDGAIIITTPHPLAIDDAMRAEVMFQRLNVPIIGVVENMSNITCASCGHLNPLFAQQEHTLTSPAIGSLPFLDPYASDFDWQQHIMPIGQQVMSYLW